MTQIQLAPSLSKIKQSRIRELGNVALGMEGVLRLQFGESTMPTPQFIKDAATQAMAEGYTFYSENQGLPSLRETIAQKYAQHHQVDLDPALHIMTTASGDQALNVSIRCVIDPGDEAIVLTPNWPNAGEMVRMFGGTLVEFPYLTVAEEKGNVRFQIDFDALEEAITPRTKLLVYTSPSNPLGWVATVKEQQQLLDLARRHGLWLLADEVYERLYYGGEASNEAGSELSGETGINVSGIAPSILRLCTRDDAVIVIQSFSKTYCMTGWRLGWLVSRADLIEKAAQLNEFIVSHPATMIQRAGEIALKEGESEIQHMLTLFRQRRDFCYDALSSVASIKLPKPGGAFYVFPHIQELKDSFQLAWDLLTEEKVSIAPGVAFGEGGEGAIRICYAPEMDVLEPAIERIIRFIERGDYSL